MIKKATYKNKHENKYENHTYSTTRKEYPQLSQMLLKDLLGKGYSDVDIGFCTSIKLHDLRKIINGDTTLISRKIFLSIMGLYTRAFCDWYQYKEVLFY